MAQLVLSEALSGDKAPTELLILKYGVTSTVKGPYTFTPELGKEVMDIYIKRGLELYFDYNHLSLDPEDEEQGKAAGWFKLELREDGLWAVDIKWTDKARALIENKEYRYISPVIITKGENSEVIRLVNVALTNLPATDDLAPLIPLDEKRLSEKYSHINFKPTAGVRAACKRGLKLHEEGYSGDGLMPDTVAWARKLASGQAWSPEKAVKARAWFERHESDKKSPKWNDPSPGKVAWLLWGGDAGRSQVNKIVSQMEKADNASKSNSEEVILNEGETMQDKMKHLKHLDESMDYLTAYSMHVAKAMIMVDDKDMDGDEDKDVDQDGMREMYKDHMDTLMEMADGVKACRAKLEAAEYVKKDDAYYMLGQLVKQEANIDQGKTEALMETVKSITGKQELNEVMGVLMALKDSNDKLTKEVVKLQEENKELNEKMVLNERLGLVEKAVKDGKLFPAQKKWALSIPLEMLKSYLEVTPVLLTAKPIKENESAVASSDVLSPVAKQLLDKLNEDIDKAKKVL